MGVTYTCKELRSLIERDGWYLMHTSGSHQKYTHPTKPGYVTIAFHNGVVNPKTANSILKQAGLKGGSK